jgi:hypothetical protein
MEELPHVSLTRVNCQGQDLAIGYFRRLQGHDSVVDKEVVKVRGDDEEVHDDTNPEGCRE